MEKHSNQKKEEINNTMDQFDEEEDIDYEELTSHKIDKSVSNLKNKKRLIIILEHA